MKLLKFLRSLLFDVMRLLAPSRTEFTWGEVTLFLTMIAIFLIVFYC